MSEKLQVNLRVCEVGVIRSEVTSWLKRFIALIIKFKKG